MLKKGFYIFMVMVILSLNIEVLAAPTILAEGAILIEAKTNTVLYEKNGYKRFYPASMTKLLTALIVEEQLPENTKITKTAESVRIVPSDSSHIGLQVGNTYSKIDGLYGLLLGSDNFIAHDLACKVSGSVAEFAKLMNEKAAEFGAIDSHFVNPHGYHHTNHYTTPYDMAQIVRGVLENERVQSIAGTLNYSFQVMNQNKFLKIVNSSRLLKKETPYYNANVVACKTGFHDAAKQTLVAKAVYGEMELIAVVMRENTPNQYIDVNQLLEYGKNNYSLLEVDGQYEIKNHTASSWSKSYITLAINEGWHQPTVKDYTAPMQIEELVIMLKKLGIDRGAMTMSEISQLTGLVAGERFTRGQAAQMIRYISDKWQITRSVFIEQPNILDLTSAHKGLQEDVQFVVQRGMLGSANMKFRPNDLMTREEAIGMLYKLTR